MLSEIIYFPVIGLPIIMWGGIFTFLLFILAAYIGWKNSKGINKPPFITFQMHKTIALIAIISGLGHGLLAIIARIT